MQSVIYSVKRIIIKTSAIMLGGYVVTGVIFGSSLLLVNSYLPLRKLVKKEFKLIEFTGVMTWYVIKAAMLGMFWPVGMFFLRAFPKIILHPEW